MGDRLLIASCAGWFYALDKTDGEIIWKYDIKQDGALQFHSEMLVKDDRVIIGTDGNRGNGHAFDLVTGQPLWTHPCGTALRTDIRAVGDTIIGVAKKESDELFCLNVKDGKQLWFVEHDRLDAKAFSNTPAIVGDRVYYGSADGRVMVYDVTDGHLLQAYDVGQTINTSLTIVGRYLYGGADGSRIFRLNLESGKVDGSYDLGGNPMGAPAFFEFSVAIRVDWRSEQSKLIVLDPALNEVRWQWAPENKQDFGTIARLHRHDNAIILGTQGGRIFALNIADGTMLWHTKVEQAVRSAGFHDGVMYVGTIPGMVYAIRIQRQSTD